TELVRSFQIGRQANSLAAIIEIVLVNMVIAVLIFVMMISFNVETISIQGSLLFGITIGMAGIMGASIALVMSQIMPTSSFDTVSSFSIVGLIYLIRAVTDVFNIGLFITNPLRWTYLTFTFTDNNWLPIVIAFLFSIIVVVIAIILESARDMG